MTGRRLVMGQAALGLLVLSVAAGAAGCSSSGPSPAPASTALEQAAASPLPSLPAIPLPEPALDALAPEFPVPEGAELLAAQADGDYVDAYRTATWRSPDDVASTTSFYEALSDGRWTSADEPVTTTIGSTLDLADAESVFDRAGLSISADPPGALIAVRFLPPGGPAPVAVENPDEVITFGTLPPASPQPFDLPAWASPEGAELVDATSVAGVAYAEFLVPGDPAAVLDAYGRALDEAEVEREVTSSDEAIVIFLIATDPPGSIALARDPAGTRAYLTLP